MRIISKKILIQFYEKHASSKESLQSWFLEISDAAWGKPNDMILQYPSADVITGKRFVFNIKGNHYRLVVDVEFKLKLVFIVWVGAHADYDKINVKEVRYVKNN
nr:type II toxin-antitoxin system HigB family toxin [uncultured Pedobacter sp.]